MKKITLFSLLPLIIITLVSCKQEEIVHEVNIKEINYFRSDLDNNLIEEKLSINFFDGSELPYISLTDAAKILNDAYNLHASTEGKIIYTSSFDEKSGSGIILQNYFNDFNKCVFNEKENTIKFEDYVLFLTPLINVPHGAVYQDGEYLKYLSANEKVTNKEYKYNKSNNDISIDLDEYYTLKNIKHENNYYIQVATLNTLFLSTNSYYQLTYNFKDLYLLSYEECYSTSSPINDLTTRYVEETTLIEQFNEEFSKHNYDQLLLLFNYQYGNKDRYSLDGNYDKYFTDNGIKEDILSGDVIKLEEAFYKLTNGLLYDGHTGYIAPSLHTDEEKLNLDKIENHPFYLELYNNVMGYRNKKYSSLGATHGLMIKNDTIFVMFNSFEDYPSLEIDGELKYPQVYNQSTVHVFSFVYDYILNNSKIKNIVIDVSNNTGGSSDAMYYVAGTLIGDVESNLIDAITGATSTQYIKTDINHDGKFDENDKSLHELGYNIAVMTSPSSFSCGNLLPYVLKTQCDDIVTIGGKTGGGTCGVFTYLTPSGTVISLSGRNVFAYEENGKYYDVEDGLTPDYPLTIDEMYDFDSVKEMLTTEIFI